MTEQETNRKPGHGLRQFGALLIVIGVAAPIFMPMVKQPGMSRSTLVFLAVVQDVLTAGILVGLGLVFIGYMRRRK